MGGGVMQRNDANAEENSANVTSGANRSSQDGTAAFDPMQITRPERALLKYYMVTALLTGPGFPLVFLPLFFKYETLRYKFDSEGVSMSWGILFRREVYLTYRRIQDIHLTGNLIQRWLGLANVSVQTASGSAMPEMVIEGVSQANELRDFLYSRMRGAEESGGGSHAKAQRPTDGGAFPALARTTVSDATAGDPTADDPRDADVTALLTDIRDCLRALADRSAAGQQLRREGE